MKIFFPFFLKLIVLLTFSLSFQAMAAGQLEKKHLDSKLTCAACHDESPPAKAVPKTKCESCHGDVAKVAEKTKDIHPNPHISHLGPMDCGDCHHVHKASVIKCNECHVYDFERGK